MRADVISVTSSDTTLHCLDIMTQKRVRHLPVMNDDKMVGMLSIGDLVKAIMAEQAKLISQLQQYITG
jgi:CBS domain-containing protein